MRASLTDEAIRFQHEHGAAPGTVSPDASLLDTFFIPAGAEAYRRDNPDAEIHLLDAGHFALETHHQEIAGLMRDFLARRT